jgi:Ca2+-binding RTX toxin-like protein
LPSVLFNGTGMSVTNNNVLDLKGGADISGGGTLTNGAAGTITKPDSPTGTSDLSATVDNFGTLRGTSGLINVTGSFPAMPTTRLNRGTYEMIAPGKIKLPGDVTNNAATILLDGATAQLQDAVSATNALANLTVNSGSLTVRNGKTQPVGALGQSGTVVIGTASTLSAPSFTQSAGTTSLTAGDSKLTTTGAANVNGGALRGIGTVQTGVAGLSVNTTGRLEPGLSGPGTLSVSGKVTLGAASTLGVDVNGTGAGQADKVVATGVMTVGGKIDLATGYTPALGDTSEILTGSSRTGSFTSAAGGDLPGDISWGATYGATNVVLRASRPSATIDDVSVTEGNASTKQVTFTVTQTETLLTSSSVSAQTADGTALVAGPAVGGSDYEANSGALTIPFGQTTATFTVLANGDAVYEHDDVFQAILSAPDNLTIGDGTANGTILNDEAVPSLTASSPKIVEKDTGDTTSATVLVSLSPASAFTTKATWATAAGTASASDFTASGGILSLTPGIVKRNIAVPVLGDVETEADETFDVVLSSPTPSGDAVVGGNGTVTIRDDDAAVSVVAASVQEPGSGTTQLTFTVKLSHLNPRPVTFNWATGDGTAVAPGDYQSSGGASTILANLSSVKIPVTVNSDLVPEGNETFNVSLTGVTGGRPGTTDGVMTILSSPCSISGTAGADVLTGTAADDIICGLAGNDTITPSGGNDTYYGGLGNDTLIPGDGNDKVYGGSDTDLTPGSGGIDTIDYTGMPCGVEVDLFEDRAGEYIDRLGDVLAPTATNCIGQDEVHSVENIIGTAQDDALHGGVGANTIRGQAGDDILGGEAGDDTLFGGTDRAAQVDGFGDYVSYNRHNGQVVGIPGVTVNLALTTPQNTVGAGTDQIREIENVFGTNSSDTLLGNGLANRLSGLDGDDVIRGAAGADILYGLVGNDELFGDIGADTLFGNEGADVLHGGDQVDKLFGGDGDNDQMFGDAGTETFRNIEGGPGVGDFCGEGASRLDPFVAGFDCENT